MTRGNLGFVFASVIFIFIIIYAVTSHKEKELTVTERLQHISHQDYYSNLTNELAELNLSADVIIKKLSTPSSANYDRILSEEENKLSNIIKKEKKKIDLSEQVKLYENKHCEKEEKIYFLKTSKTGSTSVANIISRFGLRKNGTNFLMGESGNGGLFFKNSYMPFNAETCFLGANLPTRPVFDISYVHMRYNRTAINQLMHPDHRKITIVRNPVDNFTSSWKYYAHMFKDLRRKLRMYEHIEFTEGLGADFAAEMEEYLEHPFEILKNYNYDHSAHFFAYHPQLLFFGVPSYLLKLATERQAKLLVTNWINQIDVDFDHILILERLQTSLAVMMIKFCWDIDDVVNLKLNSMKVTVKHLSERATDNLRRYNWGDFQLYDYFREKLDSDIAIIGYEKVKLQEENIRKRVQQYISECFYSKDGINESLTTFQLKPEKRQNQTCSMITKDSGKYIQFESLLRWKKEYPEYFTEVGANNVAGDNVAPKTKYPKFCGANKAYIQWFEKQESSVRTFWSWETNEYDIRPDWPSYVLDFSKSTTEEEKSYGLRYRRIWN